MARSYPQSFPAVTIVTTFLAATAPDLGCGRSSATGDAGVSAATSPLAGSEAHVDAARGVTEGVDAADDRWRSLDGNFAVRFPYPGEPKIEIRPILGGFEHVAKTTGDFGTFLVGYDDTLKFAEPPAAPARALDAVMRSTLQANHGKLVHQSPLVLAGKHAGRAFQATLVAKDKRPVRGDFRLFVVRTRVYQLVALTPTDKMLPFDMRDRFFDSFGLLEAR